MNERVPAPQILLVDDTATNLQVLYQTLDGHGYRLLAARTGKDALAIAERARPDLILLDVMMPGMDGFATCALLKADPRTADAAIIFLSAVTDAGAKVRGLDLGAVDFINKPFQAEEVLARVRTHLTIRDLQRQLTQRNAELEHELTVAQELLREAKDRSDGVLLGDSDVAARLRQAVETAAASDEALLISGPPGSDHEAVARAVHDRSHRAHRAIICVSSLAVAPGASAAAALETGVRVDILAKLPLADGGTLYLDGIQHLPADTQRALAARIREIDERRRSGVPPDPDVRIIASTTRDVDEELQAGRLTPELRRALPSTLDLAPLRTRADDVPALAAYMLQRQAELAGRTVPILSARSIERLKRYRWPGNVRELRNVLGAALAANQNPLLDIGDELLDHAVRVGSYRLIERIGSGGMGDVWLARHQMLARPAAVKLMRELAGMDDAGRELRQRFAREAQATAELQSPHTVQLFDFGTTETGSFYYVMERLHGLDLQRMVDRFGPLPEARVVSLLRQACLSLSEAHGIGLIHRDIKPANLFVCRLGQEFDFLKVLDFGMVSKPSPVGADPITKSGVVMGTPAFLAPELASGERAFDARADLYALGCVAYWLLTAHPPFESSQAVTVLMHHASTAPAPPSSKRPGAISAEMDALVLECLAKSPASRPASADALLERLDGLGHAAPWTQRHARDWWGVHEIEMSKPVPSSGDGS
jgi:DNA-binding NtrC family response regulator